MEEALNLKPLMTIECCCYRGGRDKENMFELPLKLL